MGKKERKKGLSMVCIGVLALQGAFVEHVRHLEKCVGTGKYGAHSFDIVTVRSVEELDKCDALIIPGGESTSISLISCRTGLFDRLNEFVRQPGKAVWGTCAGLIFLSQQPNLGEANDEQFKLVKTLDLVKVKVQRNAFGRQSHSFIQNCDFSHFIPGCTEFPATFIRAPAIVDILEPSIVQSLYQIPNSKGENVTVAAKQNNNVLVTAFHPELADDHSFHDYFIREFVLPQHLNSNYITRNT